jgi:uncharacterized MAPEG superfamily protein
MTIAFWCVLAAALLPYVFAGIAKVGETPYNNRAPRLYLDSLQGRQQRAHWAQLNSYEAFPPFAAAVIIAHLCEAPQAQIDGWALAFVALRISYGWAYITDRATLRSLVWTGGVVCVVALFVIGL